VQYEEEMPEKDESEVDEKAQCVKCHLIFTV